MDVKAKLASKSKKAIDVKKESFVEKKLTKNETIKEHLKLQKEYTDEDIIIPNRFLKSITNHKIMFTNKVNPEPKVDHVNEHIIHNLKAILADPLSLTKDIRQITKDTTNHNRLKIILDEYGKEEIEDEHVEGLNLFKISGKKTHVKIGKKVEKMNAFRVYLKIVNVDGKNIHKLIFIDPYHLAIPGPYDGKPANTIKEQKFNQYKYCNQDLIALLINIENPA